MKKDTYRTLAEPTQGAFKDRGSKFLAYAYPVDSLTEIKEYLSTVRKIHPKARHWCYAYRLGLDNSMFRMNDDGEPSGTAGRPILGRIDSFDLTNTLIIVVRYFGGTLLGASGLINAYKTSAELSLLEAEIIEKLVKDVYQLTFDYSIMSTVMNTIKKLNLKPYAQDFTDNGKLSVAIRQNEVTNTLIQLKAGIGKIPLEMAETVDKIEGLDIEYVHTI